MPTPECKRTEIFAISQGDVKELNAFLKSLAKGDIDTADIKLQLTTTVNPDVIVVLVEWLELIDWAECAVCGICIDPEEEGVTVDEPTGNYYCKLHNHFSNRLPSRKPERTRSEIK